MTTCIDTPMPMVYPILSKNTSNIVRFSSPCQRKKICKRRKSRILRKPPDILGLIPAIDEDRPMQPLKNRDGKAKKIEKRGFHGLHPKHLIIVPCPKSQKKTQRGKIKSRCGRSQKAILQHARFFASGQYVRQLQPFSRRGYTA